MPVKMLRTIPILRIFTVEQAKEFYQGFLGFAVDWEHTFEPGMPVYMQVSRAGCVLHLSQHHGDGTFGTNVHIYMTGVDEYHAEVTSKGYRSMRPGIETTFYKTRCMGVIDPFGNHLFFEESIEPAADA